MSNNIFGDGLGYEGKVTLTLKSGNRVLKTQTYKNNGTANLFKFLGYCLIGSSSDVKHLLPTKIALLHNQSQGGISSANPNNVELRSGFVGLAHPPSIVSSSNSAEVKVTYSFEVGRNTINGNFNQVALYGDGCTHPVTDMPNCAAYYYLSDSSQNVFESEDIALWSATTVLLIDWELSLSNIAKATT
jgi:hypothetical protein